MPRGSARTASLRASLMEPTQPSLGPGCQGILLGPDLCLGTLHGPVLGSCIFLATDVCSGIFLCTRMPDVSVLLHGLDLCSGTLHDLCLGILYGLYGLDLCPCIFPGRPSLELREQGFGGLTLIGSFKSGSNFVARRHLACSRRLSVRG